MPVEFEAKVLEIEPDDLGDRITQLGGHRVGYALMRRYVYDLRKGDESKGFV